MRAACNTTVLAVCVGPVCAAAAGAEGVTRTVWPDPPRPGAMIGLLASSPPRLLASELGPQGR